MAGFKTHITTSSVLGGLYAAGAYLVFGVPPATCIVAGGLCSISGMLPDLDSDSGTPVRETISVVAALAPMLMIDRLQRLGCSKEAMACVAIIIYCILRFGVAKIFKHFTVHRGMWHSIPACAIAALITFLFVSGEDFHIRIFKTAAVVIGFMSHLVLDEIWSIEVGVGGMRVKKSFGTAIKFWSDSLVANVVCYAKLALLVLLAMGDPALMERYDLGDHQAPLIARSFLDGLLGKVERVAVKFEEGQGWRLVPRDKPTPAFGSPAYASPNSIPPGGVANLPTAAAPPPAPAPSPVVRASAQEFAPSDGTRRAAGPSTGAFR
jgi:hypothetical protein